MTIEFFDTIVCLDVPARPLPSGTLTFSDSPVGVVVIRVVSAPLSVQLALEDPEFIGILFQLVKDRLQDSDRIMFSPQERGEVLRPHIDTRLKLTVQPQLPYQPYGLIASGELDYA